MSVEQKSSISKETFSHISPFLQLYFDINNLENQGIYSNGDQPRSVARIIKKIFDIQIGPQPIHPETDGVIRGIIQNSDASNSWLKAFPENTPTINLLTAYVGYLANKSELDSDKHNINLKVKRILEYHPSEIAYLVKLLISEALASRDGKQLMKFWEREQSIKFLKAIQNNNFFDLIVYLTADSYSSASRTVPPVQVFNEKLKFMDLFSGINTNSSKTIVSDKWGKIMQRSLITTTGWSRLNDMSDEILQFLTEGMDTDFGVLHLGGGLLEPVAFQQRLRGLVGKNVKSYNIERHTPNVLSRQTDFIYPETINQGQALRGYENNVEGHFRADLNDTHYTISDVIYSRFFPREPPKFQIMVALNSLIPHVDPERRIDVLESFLKYQIKNDTWDFSMYFVGMWVGHPSFVTGLIVQVRDGKISVPWVQCQVGKPSAESEEDFCIDFARGEQTIMEQLKKAMQNQIIYNRSDWFER